MVLFLKRFLVGHVRLELVELIIFFKEVTSCFFVTVGFIHDVDPL